MRDLSSRHGNRRKSSSASHIGKNISINKGIVLIIMPDWFGKTLTRIYTVPRPQFLALGVKYVSW